MSENAKIFQFDTSMGSIAGGAAIGAGAAAAMGKSWKDGAIAGAIVAVLLPTGKNLAGKVGLK